MEKRDSQVEAWREHLQDEADAAFLYRELTACERDPKRRDVYRRLAEVEDRHTALWQRMLRDHGQEADRPKPTGRARLLAWTGRRFGPGLLSNMLLREEGREVKAYLELYRSSEAGPARDAAFKLARESAEHAEALGGLTETAGEPWHRAESGDLIRNVVYGFNDGLTANFGLVAGVLGAAVDPHIVIVSGIAGTIADSLSMGSSGYLAAKSEQEVHEHEIAMEADEIRLMPEVEQEELALVYEAKGMPAEDARRLAADVMADPERALAEKVREELGISARAMSPIKEGWVTGTATAVGAIIPVAPFLILPTMPAIWTSFAISMLSHFAVGAARSVFTGRGVFRSGLDMFLVGLGVAGVGYVIGDLIGRLL